MADLSARRLGMAGGICTLLGIGMARFAYTPLIPATVTLTSGSIAAMSTPARQQQLWSYATLSFALMQAVAAYGMSWGHGLLATYRPLFAIAASALLLGTLLAAAAAVRRPA